MLATTTTERFKRPAQTESERRRTRLLRHTWAGTLSGERESLKLIWENQVGVTRFSNQSQNSIAANNCEMFCFFSVGRRFFVCVCYKFSERYFHCKISAKVSFSIKYHLTILEEHFEKWVVDEKGSPATGEKPTETDSFDWVSKKSTTSIIF